MKHILLLSVVCALLLSCKHSGDADIMYNDSLPPVTEGYVGLQDGHFVLDGEYWFPLMLNYKAFIDGDRVIPAPYYTGTDLREHFDTIASWGFNAVRVCLDVMGEGDSAAKFEATRRMVQTADSAGLKVMLLIKTPFDPYWQSYTKGLLHHLADLPALWAYDFFNEPLYFDPEPERDKMDAVRLASEWRHWVRTYAPHQLFTIATAEPIEVFEWDPSMLPTDFVEMHTYHPLRVYSEMWWYSRYCGKPWMVGETGLPADNDSVPWDWQWWFLYRTFERAKYLGAIGYGWWEFQDCPSGVNFEAKYTGLRDSTGKSKSAARVFTDGLFCFSCYYTDEELRPVNYYNMLAYSNIRLTGRIVDKSTGKPVEGAVVRGWNDDWSVGMNTYTDSNGRFTLYSNDYNVHFEISAPGMSREKFDRRNIRYSNPQGIDTKNLPDRQREYQQIDYRPYLNNSIPEFPFNTDYDSTHFFRHSLEGDMGTVKLHKL
ncbi:MAG: carboxypeptidase regulatory-like domain-containing protein [Bacteroidales bacterium]|nr:carboxypeptidase regulatory-like domain-containing protein [Bacteroidales bacterium]